MHVGETRSEIAAQLVLESRNRRTPSGTQCHPQQGVVTPAVKFEDRIDRIRRRGADVSQSCLDELPTHFLLYEISDLTDDLLCAFDPRAGGGTNPNLELTRVHVGKELRPDSQQHERTYQAERRV